VAGFPGTSGTGHDQNDFSNGGNGVAGAAMLTPWVN
jgi:hypothetical protein